MSRRAEYPEAMLRYLGVMYYQTLHGDGSAFDVARAVSSVQEEAVRRPEEFPLLRRGEHGRRTGRWRVRNVMRTAAVTVPRHTPARDRQPIGAAASRPASHAILSPAPR